MQFVKASERLPEMPEDIKCSKELALKIDGDYDTGRAYNGSNGVIFCGKKYNVLTEKAFEKIFWLDENPPPPASAVDEAARLYPEPTGRIRERPYTEHEIVDIQRDVHIRCAGMYTDTIDKLKAENEKIRFALENLVEDIKRHPDDTRYAMAVKIATEELKTNSI